MRKFGLLVLASVFLAGQAAAFDEAATPTVRARAKVNLASLLRNDDYPAAARAAREEGMVDFTLDVGANGRVTGCTITRSSGSANLDSTTCRLMRSRARFKPATDANGATVPDQLAGKIVWRL